MEKFGWCFIGTGKLAHQVAKQITASGRHRVVSCYTRTFEKAKDFAQQYGADAYETVAEAVNAEGVDAVYVVTTHNVHYRNVKEALELGKPVLCEKAFTVEAKETDELIALAKEKKLYLAEAMWTWFAPAANQVLSWVKSGELGKVTEASFTYHMKSIKYAARVADPKRAGGALLDITVYPITYAYRLFGKPVEIRCTGKVEGGIDLGEEIELTFADGVKVNISASIVDMKGFEKMRIRGDQGEVKATLYHAGNRAKLIRRYGKNIKFKGEGPSINTYLPEFDTVAAEIREGLTESRMVPLEATSAVMHIMDECRRQMGLEYDCE